MNPLSANDPTKIGKYRLIGKLGEGGMGQAYLATKGGKHYVLKIILASLANDSTYASRFQREIEATRQIKSPEVVAIVDHGTYQQRLWYASEYEEGCDLIHLVQAAPLDERAVRTLMAFVSRGLAAIHRAGIVHRDIKPGNIIVNQQGLPKIIDLGVAHDSQADVALTQVGMRIGTPAYMPVEQMAGEKPQPAWDVFALGCLAVYAVTGKRAFADAHAVALHKPDLSGVPFGLRPVIQRCIDPNPRLRPQAAELVAMFSDELLPTIRDTSWLPPAAQTQIAAFEPLPDAPPSTGSGTPYPAATTKRILPATRHYPAAAPPVPPWQPFAAKPIPAPTRPYGIPKPGEDPSPGLRHAPSSVPVARGRTPVPPVSPVAPQRGDQSRRTANRFVVGMAILVIMAGIGVVLYVGRGYIPLPYRMLPGQTITGPKATFTPEGDKKTYANAGSKETYAIQATGASGYDLAVKVSWNHIWHEDIEEACLVVSDGSIISSSKPSSADATKTAEGGPGTVTLYYEGALVMTGDMFLALRCNEQTIHPIGKNAIKGGGTLSLAKKPENLYRETFLPVQVRRQSGTVTVVTPRRATGWTGPGDNRFCIKSGKTVVYPQSDEPAKGNERAWRLVKFSLAQGKGGTLYSGCDSAGNGIGRGVKLP